MAYNATNPNGQAASINSAPVVLASDQSAVPIKGNLGTVNSATWAYNTTPINTQLAVNVSNYNAVSVAWTTASTVTSGQITFEVSPNSTTGSDGAWFALNMTRINSYNVESVLNVAASQTVAWTTSVDGFTYFRVRASAALGGTAGSATLFITPQTFAIEPIVTVGQATASNLQATVTGTVNAGLSTGTNNIGYVGINPAYYPSSGGLTALTSTQMTALQSLSTTVVYIKVSSGRLYEYDFYNPNSSGVWVQIFNASSGVTLGTTVPVRTVYVPPISGRDWASPWSTIFGSGIAVACTTTSTGSGAPTAGIQAYVGYS